MAFFFDNNSLFGSSLSWEVFKGGLVFDTSAILVTNIPYIVFFLLPLPFVAKPLWQGFCKWLFVVVNSLALAINLADAAYFPFTMRRTTTTVFREFHNEDNIFGIILTETLHHWYFVVLAVLVVWGLCKLYRSPHLSPPTSHLSPRFLFSQLISLLIMAPFVVAGIRGGFTTAVRPITISNASQYVDRPIDAALVLNTPFALYRTIGKDVFTVPRYFESQQEMESVYTPVHNSTPTVPETSSSGTEPSDLRLPSKKNVVILIVESFGREYIGALNTQYEKQFVNSKFVNRKSLTPCVDSLIALSTTFRWSYCNGRKSIDGMPSILSGIPMFVEPFFLTPASMNEVSGIARLLADEGYSTAFFHGAQRGSMGFQAFARKTGFQHYYGREDFDDEKQIVNSKFVNRESLDDAFDGTWAIWDEPFLQYYCAKMSQMQQPFMTAVFTASSHHPYKIPELYRDVYPEGSLPIHKCIRYTDMAIGRFFQQASQQPWFRNTIFVITSDHTNQSNHDYYQTDLGGFCVPIIFYQPAANDTLPSLLTSHLSPLTSYPSPQVQPKIAQQTDILPTVMGLLGYHKPFVAFGIDLFGTAPDDTWAVNYLNGTYQYVKHGYLLQFDGHDTRAVYALADSLMTRNLKGTVPQQQQMERELKAIIQQYMTRMKEDRLMPSK